MTIEFHDLLDQKALKYGASAESPDFQQILIDAGNYTLDDIENIIGVSTTRIDSVEAQIDLDQQLYQSLLSLGVDFYMQDLAQYTVQGLEGIEARYNRKMDTIRRRYRASQTPRGVRGDMS